MNKFFPSKVITSALFVLLSGLVSHAQLTEIFRIDIVDSPGGEVFGTFAGDTYTREISGLMIGTVSFDATLTVVGSGDITQNTRGIGVLGDSDPLVSNGEGLRFSMAISNESGGTVNFDGFTGIDYNFFGSSDGGLLSLDDSAATAADNFFVTAVGAGNVDISSASPTAFSAFANSGGSNNFRVDDVTAQFSANVIPEPSTYAMILGLGAIAAVIARRRLLT